MHDDLGVGLAGEVVVVVAQQLVAELHVVGQLAVEGETEPLVLLDVVPLEGLGVTAVLRPAGRIADVADGRPARVLVHQALVLGPMAHAEDLGDRAHLLVGVDQLAAVRIEGGDAGGQLAAVLDVQEHPRHQAGWPPRGPCSRHKGLAPRPGR